MRKSQKTRLEDLIAEIEKIHKLIVSNPFENLIKCQQLAIIMGEMFETEYGMENDTTKVLEDYCEQVYLVSIKDEVKEDDCRILQKIIKIVKKRVEEIKGKYEILFLPYKSSMWDCLDSIYKAAKKEENCDVHVVPIPYYSMNEKHDDVEMFYEYQYYSEIGISIDSYKEYDISKEKPDVIFIHNPYDGVNRITQVPEKFFSSELCKYTDHLVYIPYYLTRGTELLDNFIVLPGVKNSWRTIVQSEEIRKKYLEYFSNEKIVALGSPKIDAVLNCEYSIPEEWKNKITDKKIVLMNIHLRSILNKEIDFMKKITYLISISNQMGWAVLWRPHPLTLNTIKNTRPEEYDDYITLEAKYEKNSNVIIDKTSNLARAINISDVYVGDESSLVSLYKYTGKPIYITDLQFGTELNNASERKETLDVFEIYPQASLETLECIWYMYYSMLFRYDKASKKTELKASVENQKWTDEGIKKLFLLNDKVIGFDYSSTRFFVYNTNKGTFEMIKYKNSQTSITYSYQYKQKVFLVPIELKDSIICVDMVSLNVTTIKVYENLIKKGFGNKLAGELFFNQHGCIIDDNLLLPIRKTNYIVVIDLMHLEKIRYVQLKAGVKLRCVLPYKDTIICTELDNSRVWLLDKTFSEIKISNTKECWDVRIGPMIIIGDNMWFMQQGTGVLWKVSLESLDCTPIVYSKQKEVVISYDIMNDHYFRILTNLGMWIVDTQRFVVSSAKIKLNIEDANSVMVQNNFPNVYSANISIRDFLKNYELFTNHPIVDNTQMQMKCYGSTIWKYIYKQL